MTELNSASFTLNLSFKFSFIPPSCFDLLLIEAHQMLLRGHLDGNGLLWLFNGRSEEPLSAALGSALPLTAGSLRALVRPAQMLGT